MTTTDTTSAHDRTDSGTSIYDHGDIYEAIYMSRGKDYAAESALVTSLVRERLPEADSLLDVGCGAGSHLQCFAGHFGHAEGLDLSADMVRKNEERGTGIRVTRGDMRDFALGRRFDAVVSMFNVVAYSAGTDELDATLACFARHLNPGGVIVIEPWWLPEDFLDGYVATDSFQWKGRSYARISHTVRDGDSSHMEVHYLVASAEEGVTHFSDVHRARLFQRADYENAIRRAGCAVEYVRAEHAPRGLFIGTAPRAA
ncbi:class I SAM-dependent methyltransferase [Streptomyces aurantiacus]|uniref:Putative dTDP-3-amino-3,4,6-trideoxy-alpha-D-glucopyranose n=1 Tax=Streptomyces aurantiacus JA 4570 TaxID=1286094 RepID=S3ZZK4_9ACTN|nr:class I SAM-dependent methyltransferase [Streptomyces aurantiacus]EPH43895.1 putative dTDP-3-amino-3,4,6-trideoxy-alpha-D-glucopyranose [Streptomyces aurantiacus JA 4570]